MNTINNNMILTEEILIKIKDKLAIPNEHPEGKFYIGDKVMGRVPKLTLSLLCSYLFQQQQQQDNPELLFQGAVFYHEVLEPLNASHAVANHRLKYLNDIGLLEQIPTISSTFTYKLKVDAVVQTLGITR